MQNGWIKGVRQLNRKCVSPRITIFDFHQHVPSHSPTVPPSLSRAALRASQIMSDRNMNAAVSFKPFTENPMQVVMRTTVSRRESSSRTLKAKLVFSKRFLKEVAQNVSPSNKVSLSKRLKNVVAEYGKVSESKDTEFFPTIRKERHSQFLFALFPLFATP